jgi:hypothetical protein
MKILAYVILFLGAIAAIIHTVTTDPTTATLLTPTVKSVLGLVALIVAAALPTLRSLLPSDAASKGGGGILGVFLSAFVLGGCAWFTAHKTALEPLEEDACVLGALEAGMSNDAAAAFCKVTVEFVNSLAAKKAGYRRAAQADGGAEAGGPFQGPGK